MELRTAILTEHSRAQSLQIAAWIGNNPQRVDALIQLLLHDEYRVVQRAAWIASFVAEKYPALILPHLPAMVARMEAEDIPVAVKRNVLRILQFLPVPAALHGAVMNTCFIFLEDPAEAVAVKVFSMTVLANLATTYPEIKNEIRLLITDQLEHNPSAGFRSRAKKVMAMIKA
ncbi:hypothetical protein [Chitinophaga nivalis]|uniref:Adenylosuccinate lyase n=1 Tax=Chitinophaga nivalis TaxID=2991709 RepID=A0ABT3ILN1_9BACT|nr:hypothetical protein [Chitinophaga nivalis]MCW3465449.1 hypothetical protein [Chitinophaga nivalis]MCW3484859.1 hypothetical protein [Chitinophaga nivalis]